jgi:hypothetical protein
MRPLLLTLLALPLLAQQVPLQPLAQQVRRIEDALAFIGQPLPPETRKAIDEAIATADDARGVQLLEAALAPHVLATVDINPESRVKVTRADAPATLAEGGTRAFLIKVINLAHVTSPLRVTSPNAVAIHESYRTRPTNTPITAADIRDRWTQVNFFRKPPLQERLSGLETEYLILEVFSRDTGPRAAVLGFDVGQGTQDIGFRNDISILFNSIPSKKITLNILDEKGNPTTASLTIKDRRDRLYPNPSKRLPPDFFFQPQIYRKNGESVTLPHGYYTIKSTGGPEYLAQTAEFNVDANSPASLSIKLQRWINTAQYGWYSGDPHIHAAGCSHYQKPTEGVNPEDMIRQIAGEKLNLASVLTWGPGYYHQKKFFTGLDDKLSSDNQLMHYDLEISGFPSSDSGHLALLGLKDQDYPGAKRLEDWPTWNVPVLDWAKKQGAVTGYTHSGWGLQVSDTTVPTMQIPGFDGIGANEYIVDVTRPGTIDFLAGGDTPYVWELSIWYHTLNLGYRTRIAGETDFPCITDDRVGLSRTYVKLDAPLTYRKWIDGLRDGKSYLSDGRAHLMDFKINNSTDDIRLTQPGKVKVTLKAFAMLDKVPNTTLQKLPYDQKPYWTIERARIGDTNEIPVELIVNGKSVATKTIPADGKLHDIEFEAQIDKSAWVAVRTIPAAHTNPLWVNLNNQPILSKESAEWCLRAVQQCWSQKVRFIKASERQAARTAYEQAEQVYRNFITKAASQ